MAKQSSVERLRMVAQLNADTAKGLQDDNARLRAELQSRDARLAEIARLAAVPVNDDGATALPLDAVYTLSLGLVSGQAGQLRKISTDSKYGVALRGILAAAASTLTHLRAITDDEEIEQQVVDVVDRAVLEAVAGIPG